MRPEPSLTVISLGGGVQSSVMTLMASRGAFDRVPTAPSLQTRTGSRPLSTPTWNGWLGSCGFPCMSWTTGEASGRT